MNNFSKVNIGDTVFHIKHGHGVVASLDFCRDKVRVAFKTERGSMQRDFTLEGKVNKNDVLPSLYWRKPIITYPAPLPAIQEDAQVLVWNEGDDNKERAYFSHWQGEKAAVFKDGRDSWTSAGRYKSEMYDLYDYVVEFGVVNPATNKN